MPVSDTFKALGDPIRLEMMRRLAKDSDYTVNRLLDGLGLTRQGAGKHLQILADVELVHLQPKGRETEVSLDTAALTAAKSFIADLEAQWDERLGALRDYVEKNNLTPKK
jgi:DNA-binding transcriptional ArsR family regulator